MKESVEIWHRNLKSHLYNGSWFPEIQKSNKKQENHVVADECQVFPYKETIIIQLDMFIIFIP